MRMQFELTELRISAHSVMEITTNDAALKSRRKWGQVELGVQEVKDSLLPP